jgi:hypothetical protein
MAARRSQPEAVEQAKVIAWAQSKLAQWPMLRRLFHTPNGGMRNAVVAGQLTAMGVRKGVPDLQLHHKVGDVLARLRRHRHRNEVGLGLAHARAARMVRAPDGAGLVLHRL